MKKRLYFGHPVNTYNTDFEIESLRKISETFPDWDIENPNQKYHQEGYKRWKETTGNGMDYFFKQVIPSCHGGIFLLFRDGAWGARIYGEAKFLATSGFPIWQITCAGDISQIDIIDINEVKILSIEETRLRIHESF